MLLRITSIVVIVSTIAYITFAQTSTICEGPIPELANIFDVNNTWFFIKGKEFILAPSLATCLQSDVNVINYTTISAVKNYEANGSFYEINQYSTYQGNGRWSVVVSPAVKIQQCKGRCPWKKAVERMKLANLTKTPMTISFLDVNPNVFLTIVICNGPTLVTAQVLGASPTANITDGFKVLEKYNIDTADFSSYSQDNCFYGQDISLSKKKSSSNCLNNSHQHRHRHRHHPKLNTWSPLTWAPEKWSTDGNSDENAASIEWPPSNYLPESWSDKTWAQILKWNQNKYGRNY